MPLKQHIITDKITGIKTIKTMPEQQNIEHKQSWHDELKTMINGKCITVNKKFMQAVVRIFGHDDQTGRNSEFPNYNQLPLIINH